MRLRYLFQDESKKKKTATGAAVLNEEE